MYEDFIRLHKMINNYNDTIMNESVINGNMHKNIKHLSLDSIINSSRSIKALINITNYFI